MGYLARDHPAWFEPQSEVIRASVLKDGPYLLRGLWRTHRPAGGNPSGRWKPIAVGENSVILLHPRSHFSRRSNGDGEGVPAKKQNSCRRRWEPLAAVPAPPSPSCSAAATPQSWRKNGTVLEPEKPAFRLRCCCCLSPQAHTTRTKRHFFSAREARLSYEALLPFRCHLPLHCHLARAITAAL